MAPTVNPRRATLESLNRLVRTLAAGNGAAPGAGSVAAPGAGGGAAVPTDVTAGGGEPLAAKPPAPTGDREGCVWLMRDCGDN